MKTAHLHLRHGSIRLHRIFAGGLERCGFRVIESDSADCDLLVTWNVQKRVRGVPHLVVENSGWGNEFLGERWKTIALGQHNTAGCFPIGGPERFDSLNVKLSDWRTAGETVILAQRGIGPPGVAMPKDWITGAVRRYGGRVRLHPGKGQAIALDVDLINCGKAVTWGSGAAIKSLVLGIPVISEMPNWIGEQNNTDAGRLEMFRRLAWAQWRHSEIESGDAFRWLLQKF